MYKIFLFLAWKLLPEALKLPMCRVNWHGSVSRFHVHNGLTTVRRTQTYSTVDLLKTKGVSFNIRVEWVEIWLTAIGHGSWVSSPFFGTAPIAWMKSGFSLSCCMRPSFSALISSAFNKGSVLGSVALWSFKLSARWTKETSGGSLKSEAMPYKIKSWSSYMPPSSLTHLS